MRLAVTTVPLIKRKSHLPVFVDPSHGTGVRELVAPMAKAGAAAAPGTQARRASDVSKQYDPDAPLVIKGKDINSNFFLTAIKLAGLSVVVAGVVIALLYVLASQ